MIEVPSRIGQLIQTLEAGKDPTPDELRRLVQLQALDIAKAGEDFVKEMAQHEAEQTENFRKFLEG